MKSIRSLRPVPAVPHAGRSSEPCVGQCVQANHPTLSGRVLVRWQAADSVEHEQWLPVLMTVTVRVSDRVLLLCPSNSDEPVVVGVLDGFARRPPLAVHGGPTLELQRDEVIRVQARDGSPLLELCATDSGPLVRLLDDNVEVELAGALRISAKSIALRAERGEVSVTATDDVVLRGAGIRLN